MEHDPNEDSVKPVASNETSKPSASESATARPSAAAKRRAPRSPPKRHTPTKALSRQVFDAAAAILALLLAGVTMTGAIASLVPLVRELGAAADILFFIAWLLFVRKEMQKITASHRYPLRRRRSLLIVSLLVGSTAIIGSVSVVASYVSGRLDDNVNSAFIQGNRDKIVTEANSRALRAGARYQTEVDRWVRRENRMAPGSLHAQAMELAIDMMLDDIQHLESEPILTGDGNEQKHHRWAVEDARTALARYAKRISRLKRAFRAAGLKIDSSGKLLQNGGMDDPAAAEDIVRLADSLH